MGERIAYVRVSTIEQNEARQVGFISMAVRFMMRTKNPAGSCTGRPVTAFPSAECIRHIYQPALPDTGCLDLLPKNIIPWMI